MQIEIDATCISVIICSPDERRAVVSATSNASSNCRDEGSSTGGAGIWAEGRRGHNWGVEGGKQNCRHAWAIGSSADEVASLRSIPCLDLMGFNY
jgi:hypothetical protein